MTNQSLALRKAIDHFGGVPEMVKQAGISKAAIYFWLSGKQISAEYAIKVERATGGAVTRSELRPDLFQTEQAA